MITYTDRGGVTWSSFSSENHTILAHPYVFLAIEFGSSRNGGHTRVLGVYTSRETAQAKIRKTMTLEKHNKQFDYYGIIKKTIEGRRL